jgi:phosphate starvation-inducible protein PhoH
MSKKKRLQNKRKIENQATTQHLIQKDKSPVVHQRNKIEHYLTIFQRELTEKQKKFIELAMDRNVKLLLVSGPAGSTKTYLSVLASLMLMNEKKVSDILYVRSVVESADVKMGTLPG